LPERTRRSSDRAIAPRPAEPGPNPFQVKRAAPWPAIAGTPCPRPSDLSVGGISKRSHRVRFAGHGAVRLAGPNQNDIWAERFNQTLLREWAYVRRYDTNQERLDALPGFVDRYNRTRPHGSLNGQSPMTVLVNNVSGNHS
jgi:transposase InsO family protein